MTGRADDRAALSPGKSTLTAGLEPGTAASAGGPQAHALGTGSLPRLDLGAGQPLPERYHQLFKLWFIFGFPAFGAVAAIFWLMITRPVIELFGTG